MKKIHRFLQLTRPTDETQLTDPALIHQIVSVLKLSVGETIGLFYDGEAERVVEIVSISATSIAVTAGTVQPLPKSPKRIVRTAVAIPKSDHLELIVQKLSELGVREIIPLITDRTIKTGVRLERLQTISDEAVELSGGVHRVQIHEPVTLSDALTTFSNTASKSAWIIFDEHGNTDHSDLVSIHDCIYAIGPEGGWSDRELELFKEHGATICTLAPRTLRAETAAILGGYKLLWE